MALWGDTAAEDQRPKFLVDVVGNRGLRETFMTDRGWTRLLDGHNPALGLTEVLATVSRPIRTNPGGPSAPVFTTPEQAVEFDVDFGELLDVLIVATDIEGEPIVFTKTVGPAFLSLTNNPNIGTGVTTANLTGTPSGSDGGLHLIEIEAFDGTLTSTLCFLVCVPVPPVFVEILDTGFNPGFSTFIIPVGVNNIEVDCKGASGGNGGNYTGAAGGIPFPPGTGSPTFGRPGGLGGKRRVTGIPVTAGDVLQIAVGDIGSFGQNVTGVHVWPVPPPSGGAGGQSFTSSGTFSFPDPGNANGGQGSDGMSFGTPPTPTIPSPFQLFMAGGGGGGGATAVASPSGTIFCCAGGGGGGQGQLFFAAGTTGSNAGPAGSNGGAGAGTPQTDGEPGNTIGPSAAGVPGGGGGGFVGGMIAGNTGTARAWGGRNGDSVPQPATDPYSFLTANFGRIVIRGRLLP